MKEKHAKKFEDKHIGRETHGKRIFLSFFLLPHSRERKHRGKNRWENILFFFLPHSRALPPAPQLVAQQGNWQWRWAARWLAPENFLLSVLFLIKTLNWKLFLSLAITLTTVSVSSSLYVVVLKLCHERHTQDSKKERTYYIEKPIYEDLTQHTLTGRILAFHIQCFWSNWKHLLSMFCSFLSDSNSELSQLWLVGECSWCKAK